MWVGRHDDLSTRPVGYRVVLSMQLLTQNPLCVFAGGAAQVRSL